MITFRCNEINNRFSLFFFVAEVDAVGRHGLTVDTNEWLGAEIVSAAGVGTVLFLSCQRGLCDWRDVTCGNGVYRRRQICSYGCHVRFPGTASSIMIIY